MLSQRQIVLVLVVVVVVDVLVGLLVLVLRVLAFQCRLVPWVAVAMGTLRLLTVAVAVGSWAEEVCVARL